MNDADTDTWCPACGEENVKLGSEKWCPDCGWSQDNR